MSKLHDFIETAGTFFLATVDGDKPKLRPLGTHLEVDGKEMFGIGDFKDVYKQIQTNPYVEIVAVHDDGNWLRYTGRAVFETDAAYSEQALTLAPHLRSIYNETTGRKLAMFHLEDATGVVIDVMGPGENIL